jgi:alpha-tubulin suppressor-like RCC1 family protein
MTPTLVPRVSFDDEAVLMVACGGLHTVAVTEAGGVFTFGDGDDHQLGHETRECQRTPLRVPAAGFHNERVVMVAAGSRHTVALSEAGHVFTWGFGMSGCLGHGDRRSKRVPLKIEPALFGGERVVFVAAGHNHTAAVTEGGRLYTWGAGSAGRLGHGDPENRWAPTLVWTEAFGGDEAGQVVMAACGSMHTLVVTQDGALWACGDWEFGQLGLNDTGNNYVFRQVGVAAFGGARVVTAAAGYGHSVAVTEDGALWTWGDSRSGQLGHGDVETRLAPTRVAADSLRDTRIGRCRPLPTTHALAFSMGTHGRLGAASPLAALAGEPGLLTMIARAANLWIGGAAGECESLVRLVGGVSVARRPRFVQTTQAGS